MFTDCPHCNATIGTKNVDCPNCGAQLHDVDQQERSALAALSECARSDAVNRRINEGPGTRVDLRAHQQLPSVCIRCGAPNAQIYQETFSVKTKVGVYIAGSPIHPSVKVPVISQRVPIPLCDSHKDDFRKHLQVVRIEGVTVTIAGASLLFTRALRQLAKQEGVQFSEFMKRSGDAPVDPLDFLRKLEDDT